MLDRVDALDVKQFRGRSVFYYQSIRPSIYKDNTFKRGYGNDMCFVEERTQQNGYKTTSSTDVLIQVFEAFGNLMVAFDENSVSRARCAKYINGMKSYVMKNLR